MSYYFNTTINEDFEKAKEIVTEALKEQGFGILTEISVNETFKKKLDLDFKKYHILGACNPNFAHQAISKEDKIGVMLPCNVILEENEDGSIEVSAVDPVASMQAVKNKDLGGIAEQVRDRLQAVIQSL
ncbi:DUF302 domain-containing protein [Balneola sp. MJW-20]|uniref:DUF302 domain-containing protein n=1 Tax=Gracilimonas aurantiaca TaxID=3234185 RepID=UPI0034677AE2